MSLPNQPMNAAMMAMFNNQTSGDAGDPTQAAPPGYELQRAHANMLARQQTATRSFGGSRANATQSPLAQHVQQAKMVPQGTDYGQPVSPQMQGYDLAGGSPYYPNYPSATQQRSPEAQVAPQGTPGQQANGDWMTQVVRGSGPSATVENDTFAKNDKGYGAPSQQFSIPQSEADKQQAAQQKQSNEDRTQAREDAKLQMEQQKAGATSGPGGQTTNFGQQRQKLKLEQELGSQVEKEQADMTARQWPADPAGQAQYNQYKDQLAADQAQLQQLRTPEQTPQTASATPDTSNIPRPPQPGAHLGQNLDAAKAILAAAGGDPNKARELAKAAGWTF